VNLKDCGQRAQTVVNTVRMNRKRRFVLVEGVNDYRFLANYLSPKVKLLHLHDRGDRERQSSSVGARDAVIKACQQLSMHQSDNYVGLADADLHVALGATPSVPRMVFISLSDTRRTSCIDLESCLLQTNALRKVCIEVLGPRIDDLGGIDHFVQHRREWLRETSMAVGAYRAAVMDFNRRGIRVSGISSIDDGEWRRFVDVRKATFSRELLDRFMATCIFPENERASIKTCAADLENDLHDTWLLSRGHDMTQLLAMSFSDLATRGVSPTEVESKLRIAFEGSMLDDTAFGRQLRQLEYAGTAGDN
jgi:hypothetical protein